MEFKHKKLFVPGPVEVRKEILEALSTPMIGHRGKEFKELYSAVVPKLQKLLYTKNKVFLGTHSATGWMEASIRNCVRERCLNAVLGAFSKRWHEITLANGKQAEKLEVEMGKAIKPEMIKEKLSTGNYDALTLVHNETSTGVMNPLEEIAEVMKEFPEVMFLVDTVSSMGGVKIEVDRLGIDVCLASVQKAFGLPPGFSVAAVSEKALEKSAEMENKGYYFDFKVFEKYDAKQNTPTTPSIPHIFALNKQLDRMFQEGLENRFQRHKEMAEFTRKWAKENFALFPEEGYESITLTAVKNTKGISVASLNEELGKRGFAIANGYGELKEKTFRIAHMADLKLSEVKELIENIDGILSKGEGK